MNVLPKIFASSIVMALIICVLGIIGFTWVSFTDYTNEPLLSAFGIMTICGLMGAFLLMLLSALFAILLGD